MDPRLLRYYNQELRYLREMGAEFARDFPKVAGRLGLENLEVADPYVERLLEGCAFLAARVQLKHDAEFPQFAQTLLDMVAPNLGAPVPSMLVAQLAPAADPALAAGFTLPRGSVLRGPRTALGPTRCEFRSAQPVTLTPLRVSAVEYRLGAPEGPFDGRFAPRPRSHVRVRLALPPGLAFRQLKLDTLRFWFGGLPDVALRLHELVSGRCTGVLAGQQWLPASAVAPVGFDDAEAMLPATPRGLAGARLLQEYFAFPQRFLFVDLHGLQAVFARHDGPHLDLVFGFDRHEPRLDGCGEPANFSLHCVPAVNLFERRAERIPVDERSTAFHIVPDRLAGADFEVHEVLGLSGFGDAGDELQFRPLFDVPHADPAGAAGFFSCERQPRLAGERTRREGPRSGYIGTEVYVSLVDLQRAPWRAELRQIGARLRCTNRDLPLFLPVAEGLALDAAAPVERIAIVAGPSRPQGALREGPMAWRLLSLLSLNHLSLVDADATQGAQALRELLALHAHAADAGLKRQIDGLRSVHCAPVVRRHPAPGPIAFGRGLEIGLTVDELAFEGGSAALLGAVLHRWFTRHVSMNGFVQTRVESLTRGELQRWQPLAGTRALL